MEITSPFISSIPKCRSTMRRLRKRIYKFLIGHKQNQCQKIQKNKGLDFMKLLRRRRVPEFIIRELADSKQKGTSVLKKLIMRKSVNIEQIIRYTDRQQSQTLEIFQNGLNRMPFSQQSSSNLTLQNTASRKFCSQQRILQSSISDQSQCSLGESVEQIPFLDLISDQFEKFSGPSVELKYSHDANCFFEVCSKILGESPGFLFG